MTLCLCSVYHTNFRVITTLFPQLVYTYILGERFCLIYKLHIPCVHSLFAGLLYVPYFVTVVTMLFAKAATP